MKLYKYYNESEHSIEALQNNSLFFSNPETFNDPFDSKLFIDYQESVEDIIIDVLNQELLNGRITKDDYNDFVIEMNKSENKKTSVSTSVLSTLKRQKYYASVRVSCFSMCWNSLQMWAHYANKYKGFCLGFETISDTNNNEKCALIVDHKHKNILPSTETTCILPIYRVKYRKSPGSVIYSTINEQNILEKYIDFLTTKEINWAYEKEWRAIINNNYETNLINYDIKSLSEIIFGLRCDKTTIDRIIKILEQKKIRDRVSVWKTTEGNLKYCIDKEKIV